MDSLSLEKKKKIKEQLNKIFEQSKTREPFLAQEEQEEFDTKYQYSYVPMEIVESNIEEYVIPELQEACKSLWARNIFTFMCSNRNDGGAAYIILEALSDENKVIWNKLHEKYPENYKFNVFRHSNNVRIDDVTNMSEEEISTKFMKLCKHFLPQDVQCTYYSTPEQYLIQCGCYDEIPNPEYEDVGIFHFHGDVNDIESLDEAMMEYDAKCDVPETIKTFNKTKMTKSFEDYVRENGDEDKLDATTGNVYQSAYFLKKHLDYVNSQKQEQTQEKDL